MDQLVLKESVLQKDFRIRLPKQIAQLGYVPGEDFFDVVINSKNGDIILKKSNSGRVNNYGKNK